MKKIIFINPKIWILFFAFLFIATLVPTFYISIIFDIKIGIIFFVVSYFSIFFLKILLGFYKIDREMSKEIILIGRKKKEYFLEEGKIYFFFFTTKFSEIFLIPRENQIFGENKIKVTKVKKEDDANKIREGLVSFDFSFKIEKVEAYYKFCKKEKLFIFNNFQNHIRDRFFPCFDCFFQIYGLDKFILRSFTTSKENGKFEDFCDSDIISLISELEEETGIDIIKINFEVDETS